MTLDDRNSGLTPTQKRDVRNVALGVCAVTYGANASSPLLAAYRERLGLSDNQTMGIFAVYVIGIFATLFVAGPLSDRFGRRNLSVPFVALSAIASLLMVLGRDSYVMLLTGRMVLGTVSGCVLGVGAAWIQELMGEGQEQRAAVLMTIVTYVGFCLGPASSAALYAWVPHPLVVPYLIHAGATVLLLPGLIRASETVQRLSTPAALRVAIGVPVHARRSFALTVIPAGVWVFTFASVPTAFFPVLVAGAVNVSAVTMAGMSGSLTAVCGVLARPLVARVGPRRTLRIGLWLGFAGYVSGASAYAVGTWVLLVPAAVFCGAASGALTAGCLTLLGQMSDEDTRGACVSTFYLLAYPGAATPLLVSVVATATSTATALLLLCAVAGLGAMIVGFLSRIDVRS